MKVKKFSPCKVNLMLAITGVRPDGFHELVSLVTPTRFGDELYVEISDSDSLKCNMEGVPCDSSNLVMRAAEIFRRVSGRTERFAFDLQKKIPAGAGLGGGSSNGAAALAAVNELCGNPLPMSKLADLAAELGSDCPLFLSNSPVVMRGRGEKVFPLFGAARRCLERVKFFVFKPEFSINTGWAYSQMKKNPSDYIDRDLAENIISEWLENPCVFNLPLVNNMQIEAFKKYPALEVAIEEIKKRFRVPCMMSGSGSACFAVVNDLDGGALKQMEICVKDMLGESCITFIED